MDFRSVSKSASTRLAIPSTNMTPQLEDYDLLHNVRDFQMCMATMNDDEPFHLVLNLACVLDEELALTFPEKNVFQVQLAHTRKDMAGVPFARECVYKFILPDDVSKNSLTALWTKDDYLIVVESSNVVDSTKDGRAPGDGDGDEAMDVDEAAVEPVKPEEPKAEEAPENRATRLQPRKVPFVLKPNLNPTILRQSMEHAELGLFYAKRIVQNCSFVCPDAKDIVDIDFNKTLEKQAIELETTLPSEKELEELIEDPYRQLLIVKKVDLPKGIANGSEASVKPVPM